MTGRRRRLFRAAWRTAAVLAAVVALVVALVWFGSSTDWARERVRLFVEAQLSDYLGRDVEVGRVDYGLRAGTFVARDVVVPSPDPDDPPFAVVPRIEIALSFTGLVSPTVNIRRVEVDRPTLRVLLFADGTNNLPEIRPGGDGPRRVEVEIGRIVVRGGEIHFDDRTLPLAIDASAVRAVVDGGERTAEGDLPFEVAIVAQELSSTLPDARPWGGSVAAKARFVPGRIDVTAGRLSGPDLVARFAAAYTWDDETRDGRVEIVADGRAELANRLGYLDEPIDGPFRFAGAVDLDPDAASYSGTVSSARIDFGGRRFTSIAAELEGDQDVLRVDVERAGYAGGTLAGLVTVSIGERGGDEEPPPVAVDGRFADLRIERVLADLELETDALDGVTGRADGTLDYRFTTDDLFAGSGTARVDLAAVTRGARGELPLSGGGTFTIRDGVLATDDAGLAGGGQRIDATGRYDLAASRGSFDLRLVSTDLGRLVAALPLDPGTAGGDEPPGWLPTAGRGTASATLTLLPEDFRLRGRVDLAELSTPALDLDRLEAPFVLADGVLSSDDLVAEGPHQRLYASGSLDLESGRTVADYRLTSEDLGRLAAFIPFEGERPPWLPAGGRGTSEGRLVVDGGAVTGRVTAELADVELSGVTLDRLAGSATLDPGMLRDLRVEAATADGALMATGSVPLPPPGGGEAAGPVDLELQMVEWPAETLAALLPGMPEVAGRLSGDADLSGTLAAIEGDLRLSSGPVTVAGYELDSLEADATFSGSRLLVDRLVVTAPAGRVVGRGSWDRATGAVEARLAADDLDLELPPFADLVPGDLEGQVAVRAELGGTVEEPRLDVELAATGLELEERALGEGGTARLTATWRDDVLAANGSLLGLVEFDGGGRLTPEAADLAFDVSSDDLAGLVQLATPQPLPELTGSLAGTLVVEGPFGADTPPRIAVTLPELTATYEGHTVAAIEPVVVSLGPEALEIESFYVGEPGTDSEVFVAGTIGLGEESAPLDLRLQADLSTSWIEPFVPELDLEGDFRALATVRGTLGEPRLNGQGEIVGGQAIVADFPHALEDVTATVLFYPERIVLDSLRADVAGGDLRAAGRVDLVNLAEGEIAYRFQAEVDGVSVRYPEGFLLRGDASLSYASTPDGAILAGVVDLERAFYLQDVPVGVLDILRGAVGPSRLEAGEVDTALAQTQLNVAVEGADALRVRNNVANLEGDVDLSIRGSLAEPILFGQVEVERGGEIVYADNTYEVERGLVTFANPYRIDPVIDLTATTEVRSYDITLNLSGTLDRLNTSFTSDPPLADLSIIALLTTGQTLDPGGELFAAGAGGQGGGPSATTFLYGQAASVISERVNTLFGFDRFRVAPVTGAGSNVSSLAFTAGKQISSDVYVTYSRDPSTPEVDVFQVEWQVQDNVLVVLTQNGDDSYAVDVQVERRF